MLSMLFRITVWTMTNEHVNISLSSVTVTRPNYPYNCFTLDLSQNKEVMEKGLKQIFFIFRNIKGQSVYLLVMDKNLACNRDIKNNKFYSSGQVLGFQDLGEFFKVIYFLQMVIIGKNINKAFVLELYKEVFVEDDDSINCIDYPNKNHESYSACDDEFLTTVLPPGLVPIWAVDMMDNVTTKLHLENVPNTGFSYLDLPDGNQASLCKLPCSTISISSRTLYEEKNSGNTSGINLTFSQTVLVSYTHFLKFSFSHFLSDLGGSMGLWLGLGLLQFFQIIIKFVLPWLEERK